MRIRVGTLNLNGLRAAYKKDLLSLLEQAKCDIILFQEIRTNPDFDHSIFIPPQYQFSANPAQKPGYSGTLTAHTLPCYDSLCTFSWDSLPLEDEGRLVDIKLCSNHHLDLQIINFYWPSGGTPERQALKIQYLEALIAHSPEKLSKGLTLVGGDINTAPTDRDLKNWKGNKEEPGCTTQERKLLQDWLDKHNLIDTYRVLHKDTDPECYSWWSYRCKAYERNAGWRIDTIFISKDYQHYCKDYGFISQPRCSDHGLYWVDLELPDPS